MSVEQARTIVSQALGVLNPSAAYVLDHLDQLGMTLSRYRRRLRRTSVTVSVRRYDDGVEFSRESTLDEEAIYLAVADALREVPTKEISRLEALVLSSQALVLAVSKVVGPCPANYSQGSQWTLDATGAERPRLCKPAIAALEQMIRALPTEWSQRSVTCGCPARLGEVEFTIERLPV